MKCWVALVGAVLIASVTSAPAVSAGGFCCGGDWGSRKGWCHRAAFARCSCGCRRPISIYYYHPGRDYAAAYYYSRGGVGRGYSTTAYSTDGYAHSYGK
jgi:hypothetical protein